MTNEELEQLMKSTMITLSESEKVDFLNYFAGMKKLLDDFYEFPIPEIDNQTEERNQTLFEGVTSFSDSDLITMNVMPEKIKNHSIEIVSHFSK